MAASQAAAAAALEALAAGADEDEIHEAAEAAAAAATAQADDASASAAAHPWADVVSELWMLLYDGAVVAVMIASVVLMFLYTSASQTALQKGTSRFVQMRLAYLKCSNAEPYTVPPAVSRSMTQTILQMPTFSCSARSSPTPPPQHLGPIRPQRFPQGPPLSPSQATPAGGRSRTTPQALSPWPTYTSTCST